MINEKWKIINEKRQTKMKNDEVRRGIISSKNMWDKDGSMPVLTSRVALTSIPSSRSFDTTSMWPLHAETNSAADPSCSFHQYKEIELIEVR